MKSVLLPGAADDAANGLRRLLKSVYPGLQLSGIKVPPDARRQLVEFVRSPSPDAVVPGK